MGNWAGLFAILLAVGVGAYRYHDHGSLSAHASASAATTATQSAQDAADASAQQAQASAQLASQVSGPNQIDTPYLQNYMTTIQQSDRSYPFGATVQNISLPSGRAAQVTINKTKTGWCPIRNEPTYSVSVSLTVK